MCIGNWFVKPFGSGERSVKSLRKKCGRLPRERGLELKREGACIHGANGKG